jgi:aerobic carbon-monoxide dehydrogenase medium subunit
MIPRNFEYHSPRTLSEALELVGRYGDEGKVMAGGQSLIPLMKLRLLSPQHIIDLGRVEGLDYVKKDGSDVAVGAMTKMADVERSDLLRKSLPIVTDCAAVIADPLVRNMGTIGGNLSHADPTNDMPAVAVATGARMVAAGKGGRRSIEAGEFFLDTFTTALEAGELLAEVRFPLRPRKGGAYVKLERQAGDFAIVGVAASVTLDGSGACARAGIALTAAGPKVIEARAAQDALGGRKVTDAVAEEAALRAAEAAEPTSDLRGSADYKREMVKAITRRAVNAAAKRARGAER